MSRHDVPLIPFPTNDRKDPLRWPFALKLAAIVTTSLVNCVSNMGGSGISVAIPLLMQEFHKSQSDATQVLTLNFLFLSIGNIFWVPVAMKFGKRASLLSSTLMQAAAAGESIVPEVVSDTTFVHQRGAMMSIYVVLISGGSAVGPLISGFMTTRTSETWRSFSWFCFGLAIFNAILIFLCYPESNFTRPELDSTTDQLETARKGEIHKESEKAPKEEFYEDARVASPTGTGYTIYTPSIWEIIPPFSYNTNVNFLKSMIHPLRLLVHPSVWWGIFIYAITLSPQVIMIFTMSAFLAPPPYLFSTEQVGMMQIAAIVGFMLACFGGGFLSDVINRIIVRRSSDQNMWPEQRLVSLVPGMAFGPAGCILVAFACGNQLHWSAIAVGYGLLSFGSVYTPNIVVTYIVDRHQKDAAECLVLVNIFKNLVAFLFLYVAVDWAQKNGYIQVYMIMFMLNVVVILCGVPIYYYDSRNRRNVERA
ncbi:hypothetical protein N7457_002434 [Penicillium paradoxum]|uniref:uncharacterized protein n=1 Tax=Penicillium paradoxum TaxID=176176 RepID=UPI00254899DF|nr:uncharacterized protein N7457_002434 [Penicillium paradoxum]KAJ5787444.1 hypothetical protein N7457_002434 [Penicillium paradoxum]